MKKIFIKLLLNILILFVFFMTVPFWCFIPKNCREYISKILSAVNYDLDLLNTKL